MTKWFDFGGGLLLTLYAVALLAFDRYLSSRPSRDLLLAYLGTLKGGAGHQPPSEPAPLAVFKVRVNRLNNEIHVVQTAVEGKDRGWFLRLFRPISVTKVLSAWRQAHEIEEKAWVLATRAELTNRLSSAASELDTFAREGATGARAHALAARITNELEDQSTRAQPQPKLLLKTAKWQFQRAGKSPSSKSSSPNTASSDSDSDSTEQLCALTQEAVSFLYDQRDTKFQSLASRQTQSVWLAVIALALIVTAGFTTHHQLLFVFGALGAFISRLSRVQSGVPKEDDYGVSSGTLYLSLPAGAIAGWVGVLVASALALPNIHVLSGSFRGMWSHPTHILAAAVAVAFGFSERLLNRVLDQTANTVSGGSAKATSDPKK